MICSKCKRPVRTLNEFNFLHHDDGSLMCEDAEAELYYEKVSDKLIISEGPLRDKVLGFYIAYRYDIEDSVYLWPDGSWKFGAHNSDKDHAYFPSMEDAKAKLAEIGEPKGIPIRK